MRILMIGLLTCGLAAGALSQAETSAAAATAPAANTAAAPAAAAESAPAFREVTIPAGTRLPIVLDTSVGSDTSRVEQAVHAHLSQPIVVHGQTILPSGSRVSGVVT